MFVLNFKIKIGDYLLQTLDSVTITKDVQALSDIAKIVIPGTHINRALEVEDKLRRGDKVTILLGYNDELKTEFEGYLEKITSDDNSITLECVDALFLLSKRLADKEYKSISLKNLLKDIIAQIDNTITIECAFEFGYSKFVVFKSTGVDVLKKIQEETKANIYFRGNTLYIQPQYSSISDRPAVIFDFAKNIEKSELRYVKKEDKKIEIEIKLIKPDGKVFTEIYGQKGGQKIERTVAANDAPDLKAIANNEYNLWAYDGFEGNFTAWLVPWVEPSDTVILRDASYQYKSGKYFVSATELTFNGNSGGGRKITISKRLA